MGVLFAAFLRVPLTSVFMVLEVSGNYSIVLPVILANTIAYLVSRSLQPYPIFETFTHQDGLDLPSMEEQREESVLHLEDALRPVNLPIFPGYGDPAGGLGQLGVADAPGIAGEASGWFLVLHESRRVHLDCGDADAGYCCWNAL